MRPPQQLEGAGKGKEVKARKKNE